MSNDQDIGLTGIFVPDLGELKKNWGWLLALGILFMVLGTIGLGMQFFLTIASVQFIGILILIGGVVQAIHAFTWCKGWKGTLSHVLIALLYIVTGVTMVANPLVASTLLTLIIGISFLFIGILRAVSALQHRTSKSWGWGLLSGILGIVIGIMIMSSWPYSGLWVIGLFVAIELLIAGWSYIFLAFAVKGSDETKSQRSAATDP